MRLLALFLCLAGPAMADGIPILTYHRFDPAHASATTIVTDPVFASQMDWLDAHHVRVAPLREVLAIAHGGAAPAQPTVVITADDGWKTVYTDMFPIILRHRFPITLFINPPAIGHGGAYLTWPMIAEMVKSGLVDVQAHTLTHPNFNVERQKRDPEAYQAYLTQEIAGSRTEITQRLGLPADLLAWPFGIHDPTLEATAKKAGYLAAFALGSRALVPGDPDMALPRYQIYDTDRDSGFGWVVEGHPRLKQKATP